MSARDDTETVDGREGTSTPAGSGVELRRGAALDHFIVLDELGRGGMGVVVCAYDPDVDRRVAIKVLHEKDDDSGEARRRRALREAQAMGKLSHPNVVTVYEVGVVDHHPFIVMEYMDGTSLRTWLDEDERSVDDILDVFRQAAHGLAAAHDAGLVHRDFKPENVLIDGDGRTAVADFGIAGAAPREHDDDDDDDDRTRGVGTPAYMSPEQHDDQPIDARSDQFSYCVALHEAIHGQRPFSGDSREQIADRARVGDVESTTRPVPAWLRDAIARGLSPDPADRFGSMRELVLALEPPSSDRKRFVIFAIAAAVVAAAAVATFAMVRSGDEDRCGGAPAKVAGVWNGSVVERIKLAFDGTGRADTAATHTRVVDTISAYLTDWTGMYTDACRATHVYHEQSPALLDRRSMCLNERLSAVAGLADVLTGDLTGDQLDNAYHAARALPSIDECADIERLEAVAPPPADEAARKAVDELREKLLRAEALANTGGFREALPDVVDVVAAAELVGYAPLTADAQYIHGYVLWELGEHDESARVFELAIVSAGHAADDQLAVTAMGDLMVVIGLGQQDVDRALGMVPVMRALVARAGNSAMNRALLHKRHSTVLYRAGSYVEAEKAVREALAIYAIVDDSDLEAAYARRDLGIMLVAQRKPADAAVELEAALAEHERLLGADHPELLPLLDGLGAAYARTDRTDQALAQHRRALAVREKVFGANHWKLSTSLNNLGTLSIRANDYTEAQQYFERSLAARATSGHGEDESTATTTGNLGLAYRQQKKYEEAAKYGREAVRMHTTINGADHLKTAYAHRVLAATLGEKKDYAEALKNAQASHEIRKDKLGDSHKSVAESLLTLGIVHWHGKRCDLALVSYRRALRIFDGDSAKPSVHGAVTLAGIAKCRVELGRHRDAIEPAESALSVFESKDLPGRRAGVQFVLAQALWTGRPSERERAEKLARTAFEYVAPIERKAKLAAEIRAWLEAHPAP